MGKRKAAAKKPTGPRKKTPLPTIFPCLFCNHEKSVMIKLDKRSGVGYLNCKVCNQQYQCAVNYLSAAVDVYSDWVDACDAVAKIDGELQEQSGAMTKASGEGGANTSQSTLRRFDEPPNYPGRHINNERVTSTSGYVRPSVTVDDDDY